MTSRPKMSRWLATSSRGAAIELTGGPIQGNALSAVLSKALPPLGQPDFLIVRAVAVSPLHIRRAQEMLVATGSKTRLCLAGRRDSLEHLPNEGIDRVGLMLDDLDLQTPCSELIWDGFEAVCFSKRFVSKALRDLRVSCALESMLSLARELGLRTLGACGAGERTAPPFAFDYLPASTTRLPRSPPGAAATSVSSFRPLTIGH
jgi:hypothetical protein